MRNYAMDEYSVKVIVATHKKYVMPQDRMYQPVHVGASIADDASGEGVDLGYVKDNTGDNISELNASFCELTGLYWAYKNLEYDYLGLVHYRRHFSLKRKGEIDDVVTYNELSTDFGSIKVFVPKKRRYYIETLYSHYAHTHDASQLDKTREIIKVMYPEYLKSYDKVVNRTYGYMFNMMIMDKERMNDYCTWLFDILFELQQQIDTSMLSKYQGRCYGRISEIIFNVWLEEKMATGELTREDIKEIPFIYIEDVNWVKKGFSFICAKFLGKKYDASF